MSVDLIDKRAMRNALRPILLEAREEDTRSDPAGVRHPFFHPVAITLDDGRRLSAFSRDLSSYGIGLMHVFELPKEEIYIAIATGRGYVVKVRTIIRWCKPCGDGFYSSGGHFISVPTVDEE